MTQPPTQEKIKGNAKLLQAAVARATEEVLGKPLEQAERYITTLPPGHLEDALSDRMAVGVMLFPEKFPQVSTLASR